MKNLIRVYLKYPLLFDILFKLIITFPSFYTLHFAFVYSMILSLNKHHIIEVYCLCDKIHKNKVYGLSAMTIRNDNSYISPFIVLAEYSTFQPMHLAEIVIHLFRLHLLHNLTNLVRIHFSSLPWCQFFVYIL